MGNQHKPPSRIRYEATHPAITFRVPRDIYERLREYKKETGKTYSEIIAAGIEIEQQLRDQYYKGMEAGRKSFEEAIPPVAFLETPTVLGKCKHCGRPIHWTEKDSKDFIRLWYMYYRNTCPACTAKGLK